MSSAFFRFQIDCSLTENHYLLTIWYNDYGNHQTRAIFYAEVRLNETYDKHLPVMRNEFVCQKYGFSAGSINVGPLGYYPKTLRISDCDGLPIVIRIADLIRDIVA